MSCGNFVEAPDLRRYWSNYLLLRGIDSICFCRWLCSLPWIYAREKLLGHPFKTRQILTVAQWGIVDVVSLRCNALGSIEDFILAFCCSLNCVVPFKRFKIYPISALHIELIAGIWERVFRLITVLRSSPLSYNFYHFLLSSHFLEFFFAVGLSFFIENLPVYVVPFF